MDAVSEMLLIDFPLINMLIVLVRAFGSPLVLWCEPFEDKRPPSDHSFFKYFISADRRRLSLICLKSGQQDAS